MRAFIAPMPSRYLQSDLQARADAFVRRVYAMRVLGLLLLVLPYGSRLLEQGVAWPFWILVGLNVLVWPHLAYWWSRRSQDPMASEFRHLVVDAVLAGFWIAVSQVDLIPAAALLSILAADRMAAGSWPLLLRAAVAGVAGFVLTWWLLGFPWQPASSLRTTALALGSLFVYLLVLSHVTYQLTRRIALQNRELDRLNLTDAGVDLPNRRFFHARASDLIASARASGAQAVLLLIDVDQFKSINDRHGHGAGDEVLREIAGLLREQAGASGFPARIGGDEFTLLLPASLSEGEATAQRLREAMAALQMARYPELQISLSIGAAQLAAHHRGLDDWMGAADRAMYVAKAAGRAGARR